MRSGQTNTHVPALVPAFAYEWYSTMDNFHENYAMDTRYAGIYAGPSRRLVQCRFARPSCLPEASRLRLDVLDQTALIRARLLVQPDAYSAGVKPFALTSAALGGTGKGIQ